jgi:hypothetical protein
MLPIPSCSIVNVRCSVRHADRYPLWRQCGHHIGVVLGNGGVIGNAYLTSVLEDPQVSVRQAAAHVTVGTSASSVNGAFSTLGMPSDLMYRYVCGERPAAEEVAA